MTIYAIFLLIIILILTTCFIFFNIKHVVNINKNVKNIKNNYKNVKNDYNNVKNISKINLKYIGGNKWDLDTFITRIVDNENNLLTMYNNIIKQQYIIYNDIKKIDNFIHEKITTYILDPPYIDNEPKDIYNILELILARVTSKALVLQPYYQGKNISDSIINILDNIHILFEIYNKKKAGISAQDISNEIKTGTIIPYNFAMVKQKHNSINNAPYNNANTIKNEKITNLYKITNNRVLNANSLAQIDQIYNKIILLDINNYKEYYTKILLISIENRLSKIDIDFLLTIRNLIENNSINLYHIIIINNLLRMVYNTIYDSKLINSIEYSNNTILDKNTKENLLFYTLEKINIIYSSSLIQIILDNNFNHTGVIPSPFNDILDSTKYNFIYNMSENLNTLLCYIDTIDVKINHILRDFISGLYNNYDFLEKYINLLNLIEKIKNRNNFKTNSTIISYKNTIDANFYDWFYTNSYRIINTPSNDIYIKNIQNDMIQLSYTINNLLKLDNNLNKCIVILEIQSTKNNYTYNHDIFNAYITNYYNYINNLSLHKVYKDNLIKWYHNIDTFLYKHDEIKFKINDTQIYDNYEYIYHYYIKLYNQMNSTKKKKKNIIITGPSAMNPNADMRKGLNNITILDEKNMAFQVFKLKYMLYHSNNMTISSIINNTDIYSFFKTILFILLNIEIKNEIFSKQLMTDLLRSKSINLINIIDCYCTDIPLIIQYINDNIYIKCHPNKFKKIYFVENTLYTSIDEHIIAWFGSVSNIIPMGINNRTNSNISKYINNHDSPYKNSTNCINDIYEYNLNILYKILINCNTDKPPYINLTLKKIINIIENINNIKLAYNVLKPYMDMNKTELIDLLKETYTNNNISADQQSFIDDTIDTCNIHDIYKLLLNICERHINIFIINNDSNAIVIYYNNILKKLTPKDTNILNNISNNIIRDIQNDSIIKVISDNINGDMDITNMYNYINLIINLILTDDIDYFSEISKMEIDNITLYQYYSKNRRKSGSNIILYYYIYKTINNSIELFLDIKKTFESHNYFQIYYFCIKYKYKNSKYIPVNHPHYYSILYTFDTYKNIVSSSKTILSQKLKYIFDILTKKYNIDLFKEYYATNITLIEELYTSLNTEFEENLYLDNIKISNDADCDGLLNSLPIINVPEYYINYIILEAEKYKFVSPIVSMAAAPVAVNIDPLKKFIKMKKILPAQAMENKMTMDSIPPDVISKFILSYTGDDSDDQLNAHFNPTVAGGYAINNKINRNINKTNINGSYIGGAGPLSIDDVRYKYSVLPNNGGLNHAMSNDILYDFTNQQITDFISYINDPSIQIDILSDDTVTKKNYEIDIPKLDKFGITIDETAPIPLQNQTKINITEINSLATWMLIGKRLIYKDIDYYFLPSNFKKITDIKFINYGPFTIPLKNIDNNYDDNDLLYNFNEIIRYYGTSVFLTANSNDPNKISTKHFFDIIFNICIANNKFIDDTNPVIAFILAQNKIQHHPVLDTDKFNDIKTSIADFDSDKGRTFADQLKTKYQNFLDYINYINSNIILGNTAYDTYKNKLDEIITYFDGFSLIQANIGKLNVATLTNGIKDKKIRDEINNAKAAQAKAETDLAAKNIEITAKDVDLAAKDADLAAKDTDIINKTAELAAKDAEIANKNADIVNKDADLAAKDADLAAKDADLAAKDIEIAQAKSAIGDTASNEQIVEKPEYIPEVVYIDNSTPSEQFKKLSAVPLNNNYKIIIIHDNKISDSDKKLLVDNNTLIYMPHENLKKKFKGEKTDIFNKNNMPFGKYFDKYGNEVDIF